MKLLATFNQKIAMIYKDLQRKTKICGTLLTF